MARGKAIALLLLFHLSQQAAGGGSSTNKCSTGSLYSCPNCGGIQVEDCFDCTGYVSTDTSHNMCINRKLFQKHNVDTTDHENHYHYLWQDIVGAIVWFVMAGVATACGVGGGGIYVPLGILLLQFSPKQSSGLSQASIFGASLGGLILNARNRHPCKKIRSDPGVVVAAKRATSKEKEEGDSEDGTKTNVCSDSCSISERESEQRSEEYMKSNKQNSTTEDETKDKTHQDDENPNGCGDSNVETSTDEREEDEGNHNTTKYQGRAVQVDQTEEYEQEYLAKGNRYYTRPLINYDMALFLAPMEMAGAVLGVLIQRILPNWLYLAISGVVLSFTAYKTYKKFFAVRKKEKALEQEAREKKESEANDASSDIELAVGASEREDSSSVVVVEAASEATRNVDETSAASFCEQPQSNEQKELMLRKQYLEDDMRQYPREKIVALIVLWIGLFVLTLLKGGKGVESLIGITCESPWYSVLIVLQFLWLFGFALIFGRQLVKKQEARDKVHYPYLYDDPVWNRKALRFYGSFTFVAGIVAGLIGIGGGMVLGPLMLIMGIHPRVSSATTATMIVLTSSSVAVIFVTSGLVPWSYAVFFFFVCFAGAIFGKRRIDKYVKRTGRASLLIFILASIILFATIGVLVIMFTRLAEKDWCLDGFNAFCQVDSSETCPSGRLLNSLLDRRATLLLAS